MSSLRWKILVLSLGLAFSACGPVDIRPLSLKQGDISREDEARGRSLMEKVAEASGIDAWRSFAGLEIVFTDHWFGTLPPLLLKGWPINDQHMRYHLSLTDWSASIEFLNGPRMGERLGTDVEGTWRLNPDASKTPIQDPLVPMKPMGSRYFLALPFEGADTEIVADAGMAEEEGIAYERVFITWRSPKPQKDLDQFLVWIDPQTFLIHHVDFTYREKAGFIHARVHFLDYREVQGVFLPFVRKVTDGIRKGRPIHQYTMESARFVKEPFPELMSRKE